MPNTTTPVIGSAFRTAIAEVDSNWFGAIAVNKIGWQEHLEDHRDLNLSFLRFPGGTIAERALVVDGVATFNGTSVDFDMLAGDRGQIAYDITHPELMSPLALAADALDTSRNDVGTFSEALAFAVAQESDLGVILPVFRYFNGVDYTDPTQKAAALAQITQDVTLFLTRLKAGEFNGGDYPETILLEIGNEAYDKPIEYALIARQMIEVIADEMADSTIGVEIAVQMSTGAQQFVKLDEVGYFDSFFDSDGAPLIPELTGYNFTPAAGLSYEDRIVATDAMMTTIIGSSLAEVDTLRHHTLGLDYDNLTGGEALSKRGNIFAHWQNAVQTMGDHERALDYYLSAWTVDSDNDDRQVYGMAAGANAVTALKYFADNGVDRSAVWGVVGAQGYYPLVGSGRTLSVADGTQISPAALVLSLMAESLPDTVMLDTGQDLTMSDARIDDYLMSVFESETQFIVFASVGELEGQRFDLNVDLSQFGGVTYVQADFVETLDQTASGPARIVQETLTVVDAAVVVSFDTDYEVVRLIIDKPAQATASPVDMGSFDAATLSTLDESPTLATDQSEMLTGGTETDVIFGQGGDDTINGGGGRTRDLMAGFTTGQPMRASRNEDDYLFGGAGDDRLIGNAGDDWLLGGIGDDILTGGGGMDTFVFQAGLDRVTDFRSQTDALLIDQSLLIAGVTADNLIPRFGQVIDGDIHLAFGGGNTLVLDDFTDLDALIGRVDLF